MTMDCQQLIEAENIRLTEDFDVYGRTVFHCVRCLICGRSYAEHEKI